MSKIRLTGENGIYVFDPSDPVCHLADGGMGRVFRGWDEENSRPVAIKVLYNELTNNLKNIERIRRESYIRIKHPNLIEMLDFIDCEGVYHTISEYLDGYSLAEVIHRFRESKIKIPQSCILGITMKVLEGLQVIHTNSPQIIHRDVDPSNIIILMNGQVKLMDFGIAKILNDKRKSLTGIGTVVGKPHYSPPEQIKGENEKINPSTDLYAVGITLYELYAGDPPFMASNEYDVMKKQVEDRIPLNPLIPVKVLSIIKKATQKLQLARYQSAEEFIDDLILLDRIPSYQFINGFQRNLANVISFVNGDSDLLVDPKPIIDNGKGSLLNRVLNIKAIPGLRFFFGGIIIVSLFFLVYFFWNKNQIKEKEYNQIVEKALLQVKEGNLNQSLTEYKSAFALNPTDTVNNIISAIEEVITGNEFLAEGRGTEARICFEKAFLSDIKISQYFLGELVWQHLYPELTDSIAFEYTRDASLWGYSPAKFSMAHAIRTGRIKYSDGVNIGEYFEQSVPAIQQMAENGNPDAMLKLGIAYYNGYYVSKSSENAIKWVQKSAMDNFLPAVIAMGDFYNDDGSGNITISDSEESALYWYKIAGERQNGYALLQVYRILMRRTDMAENKNFAIDCLQQSVKSKFPDALTDLGLLYQFGSKGLPKMPDSSEILYKSALEINPGSSFARLQLGRLYDETFKNGIFQEKGLRLLESVAKDSGTFGDYARYFLDKRKNKSKNRISIQQNYVEPEL